MTSSQDKDVWMSIEHGGEFTKIRLKTLRIQVQYVLRKGDYPYIPILRVGLEPSIPTSRQGVFTFLAPNKKSQPFPAL